MTPPFASIAAELAREIASREQAYPRQVAKGHMTQREAERQIHLARAWAEDCARYAAAYRNRAEALQRYWAGIGDAPRTLDNTAAAIASMPPQGDARLLARDGRLYPIATLGAFPWVTRWRGVQDELDRRARLYPGWIAKGQLTQAEADQRNQRLTAMLHLYDDMVDWHPSNGTRPRAFAPDQTQAERASFDEIAPHLCAIMLRRQWLSPDQARNFFPQIAPAEQNEMFG